MIEIKDLSAPELAKIVEKAQICTEKIYGGELPTPEDYEATPFVDEMMQRLDDGRSFLQNKLKMLNMAD